MKKKVLEVRGLYKSFGGVHAVNNVSFDLEEGQLVAMIGPFIDTIVFLNNVSNEVGSRCNR